MSLHGIKIVVFDLDDTLCSEQQFVQSGFHAVSSYLQDKGLSASDLFTEMWQRFCAGARGAIFNEVLHCAGIEADETLVRELVYIYRTHPPRITLYPDAAFVLRHFQGTLKMGLLSDGYLQTQKNKLEVLNVKDFFDTIVFTDALGRQFWKPHPAGYQKIMDHVGYSGPECLYVADNPLKDFYGARSLEWKTIHIYRADGVYKDEKPPDADYSADIMVSDLHHLAAMIQ